MHARSSSAANVVRRRLTALAAMVAAGGLIGGGLGSAAQADDLPTGTFKLQSGHGFCARVDFDLLQSRSCITLALEEQFVYDLLTKQIRSVSGGLLTCVEEADPDVYVLPCDNSSASQKWGRRVVTGGWVVYPYTATRKGLRADEFGGDVTLDPAPSSADAVWTFPLI